MKQKAQIEKLLSKNKVQEAFDSMFSNQGIIGDDNIYDQLIILQAKFERCETGLRQGIISRGQAEIDFNNIVNALLEILDDVAHVLTPSASAKKEKTVEIVINDSMENFTSERKEDMLNVLSAMLKIDKEKIKIMAIERRNNKLAIKLQSVNIQSILELFKANTPEIENLKAKFNIISIKKIKEVVILGLKKSVSFVVRAILFSILMVVLILKFIFYLIGVINPF